MRNYAALVGLFVLLIGSMGCGSDTRTLVVVNIDGDLGGARRLHLTAKVAGFRADQKVDVAPRLAMWLPENARGQLALDVNALYGDGCSLAAGSATATVGTSLSIQVSVTLNPWPVPYCPVEMEKSGPGSVVLRTETIVDTCDTPSLLSTICTTFVPTTSAAYLSSVPDPLGYFTGWGGDCTALFDCNLFADRPRRVVAKFTTNLLTVNIQSGAGLVKSDNGEINCGKQCNAALLSGSRIKLTATPQVQDQTLIWSGACSGSDPVCEVVLNAPTEVGVRFVPYGITINRLGGDMGGTVQSDLPGIDCGQTCTATYPKGTVVTLTANPIRGFFAGWPSRCIVNGNSCTLTVDSAVQITAPFVLQTPCVAGSICWHNPLPQGNSLTRIWASPDAGIWAAGGAGTVLRWDKGQNTWQVLKVPTDRALNGIYGSSPNDVWAVGASGEIWHFDGTVFSQSPSGVTTNLNAVWGTGPADVWAVGVGAKTLHFNGQSWVAVDNGARGDLNALWGTGPSDIWAVGTFGTALHYDGNQWIGLTGTSVDLHDVWGASTRDVWAVGNGGVVQHFDGKRWTTSQVGTTNWTGIWGRSANEIYLVGSTGVMISKNGGSFVNAQAPSGAKLVKVMGLDSNIWIVGDSGRLLLWDGSSWIAGSVDTGLIGPIWGSDPKDVYTTDAQQRIWRWDGLTWSALGASLSMPSVPGRAPRMYEYSPSLRIFWFSISNRNSILLNTWDGVMVRQLPAQTTTGGPPIAAWASSPTDIWVIAGSLTPFVGFSEVYRYNGATWSLVAPRTAIPKMNVPALIWGYSPTDVWIAGFDSFEVVIVYHWDGTSFSAVTQGATGTRIVRAPGNELWTTKYGGLQRWNGLNWLGYSAGVLQYLYGGIARSTSDIWFVGDGGLLLRWNGTLLSQEASGTSQNLNAIFATGPSMLWLKGGPVLYSLPK